ncbi:MAG: methyltransferase domain-containing protein, partial [Actinomycetota bacterium]
RQWTADLTLFLHTMPAPSAREAEQLAARGITVLPGEVAAVETDADHLSGVRLRDGTVVARRALAVSPRFVARSGLLASLGLKPTAHPLGIGEYIAAGPAGLTDVPGVWVAGNVTDLMAQVNGAAAAGTMAAAAINADLIEEDTRLAVAAYRDRPPAEAGQPDEFGEAFWDERYGSVSSLWSGNPNPNLVSEAEGLPPGTALDVGCGEGADAIWLARRGWQVTGADLSAVALQRAAGHAAQAGPPIAERISWRHTDVTAAGPGLGQFDLVSAQYVHLLPGPRAELLRRLAASVAPGGMLLFVGHHPSDLQTTMGRPNLPERFFTGDDLAALLDPAEWEIVTNAAPGRPATDPEGRPVTIHDAVLRARRRG